MLTPLKNLFRICAIGLVVHVAEAATQPDYAVVVSTGTAADAGWAQVVQALVAKHSARVLYFTNNVTEVLPALRTDFPRYACFVARPTEATREFVADVHRLTRRLNDDPYTDCFWGILTGYNATNALRIARQTKPLTIHKVLSATALPMDMIESGICFSELQKNWEMKKNAGGEAEKLTGPDDTTRSLVDALDDYRPDLFVASGHASERDWMIGYRYQNGFFKCADGQLFGLDTKQQKFPIDSPNPKIYMPVGNCLMGHIDRPDCMATAWMNSAGVCQMLGYTVETWYGYMGWGVMDYFMDQPGRYTFNEAFFANEQALTYRLATYFPELLNKDLTAQEVETLPVKVTARAAAAGLTADDARGLLYDRDTVAFYGDPAWDARMADEPKSFGQTLKVKGGTYTFTITPNRGADSFKAVDTSGSQRGGRPFIAFLPQRVHGVKIISGAELNPVITGNFILVPNPGICDVKKNYRVVFAAQVVCRQ
jgi:hypothetical protein